MIHASVELVEAMKGVGPMTVDGRWNTVGAWMRNAESAGSCGGKERAVLAVIGAENQEGLGPVTCPACLALMAAARGAERTAELMVYADALEGVVAAYDHASASALPSEEALKALGRHTRAVLTLQAIRAVVPVVPGVAA